MARKVMFVFTGPSELCIAWITERKCGAVFFASLLTANVRLVVCLEISSAGLQIFCDFVSPGYFNAIVSQQGHNVFIFSNASFPSVAM